MSYISLSRGPHCHRTREYLCSFPMASPEPPISGKGYPRIYPPPPISSIGYRWQLQKNTPFSWFSREIFPRLRPKNTPFPEKLGTLMRSPLFIRVGGGWGPTPSLHAYVYFLFIVAPLNFFHQLTTHCSFLFNFITSDELYISNIVPGPY